MKASISFEFIGASEFDTIRAFGSMLNSIVEGLGSIFLCDAPRGPYVAEILFDHESMGFFRKYVQPKRDYTKANSNGSRGVILFFVVESGKIYEVNHRISWKKRNIYYCTVSDDGSLYKLDKSEVQEWLKELSA